MDRETEKEKMDRSLYRTGIRADRKGRYEKFLIILIGILLVAIFFYTFYIGQLLWGIIIDILILRIYFLVQQERRYFTECDLNEDEAGTPHDPGTKRKVRLANILITLFVLGLVVYSYFTLQFIWGVVVGLMVLFYVHMLLFSGKNL
ncbi:MAG: hypothetical protein AAGU10_00520 [Methanosarcina mazei]|uniref:hypothetical protein n=1 Tax=Methanosarcina soligelidi TaxID=1036677 RepID=UPI00064E253D|nr:hypothetical protein [Methanosarcina soligelidi]